MDAFDLAEMLAYSPHWGNDKAAARVFVADLRAHKHLLDGQCVLCKPKPPEAGEQLPKTYDVDPDQCWRCGRFVDGGFVE